MTGTGPCPSSIEASPIGRRRPRNCEPSWTAPPSSCRRRTSRPSTISAGSTWSSPPTGSGAGPMRSLSSRSRPTCSGRPSSTRSPWRASSHASAAASSSSRTSTWAGPGRCLRPQPLTCVTIRRPSRSPPASGSLRSGGATPQQMPVPAPPESPLSLPGETTDQNPSMSLKERTVAGIAWNTVARVIQQAIQFTLSVILARLLVPEDYGLVGMVAVFIGFATLFAEFGFSSAVVYRPDLRPIYLTSIFWVNLAAGVLLATVVWVGAPFVAAFYGTPMLVGITRAIGLNFLPSAFGIVPAALLRRRMAFDRVATVNVLAALVAGIVAVGLAYAGLGAWALVIQGLVSAASTSGLALAFSRWRPTLQFSVSAVRELLGYSGNLVGFGLVNYWARNADNLLIGKFLGSAALGVYSRAYSLMLLPISEVISVLGSVMFPALSSIQQDKARVKSIYLRAMPVIGLIAFPMMLGLHVVAEPFVLTLFGERWIAVAPLLRILCIVGVIQSMCSPTGWIYTSQGRTDWMFRWGIGGSGTSILGIVVGVLQGTAQVVALCYLLANVLICYPCIAIPGRLIDLRFSEVARSVQGPLLCATLMAAIVWGAGTLLPESWPPVARLTSLVALGVVSYSALVLGSRLAVVAELRDLLESLRGERKLEAQVAR